MFSLDIYSRKSFLRGRKIYVWTHYELHRNNKEKHFRNITRILAQKGDNLGEIISDLLPAKLAFCLK